MCPLDVGLVALSLGESAMVPAKMMKSAKRIFPLDLQSGRFEPYIEGGYRPSNKQRKSSMLSRAVINALEVDGDLTFLQALWETVKHNLWLTIWLSPTFMFLSLVIPLLTMMESELVESTGEQICTMILVSMSSIWFYFGTWMPFCLDIGYFWALAGAVVGSVLFIAGQVVVFDSLWPSLWIFGGYQIAFGFSFFISQLVMTKAPTAKLRAATMLLVVLGTLAAACGTVVLIYSFILKKIDMTWIEEILIVGVGYNAVVILLGRVFVGDFLRFYVNQAFGASQTQSGVNLGLVAKLTFSGSQTYALLGLSESFVLTVIVTNLAEMGAFLLNYFIVRKKFVQSTLTKAKTTFNLDIGSKSPSRKEVDPDGDGSIENNLKFSDWMEDLSKANPEAKFLILSFGEELADKSACISGATFFVASQITIGAVNLDTMGEIVTRVISLLLIEFFEDILKALLLFKISGILMARIPGGSVSYRTHMVGAFHSCALFCLIRVGEHLAFNFNA